ncbi:MAG TPA: RNA-guided endonuclease TnpB family protein [Mycobacterium sp.]|jgi:putative transposase|uniref:RNA-guided endonuclease InsQ/TnpB family protein n=1 Tax=Mycobacterium sp. TaxID=1785 RepID=UPI002F40B2DD
MFVLVRYRYRIEPKPAQAAVLARVFGCCRVVFNDALRVRDAAYQAGIKLSDTEVQRRVITQAKTTSERRWLAEVPSVALVQSANDARRAFRNFFDSCSGKRRGRQVGRPRFKSRKDRRQSFRLTRNGFRVRSDGRLLLAKIGEVRVRWSRSLPSQPSSVTIIREPDGHYYASFVVDVPPCPLPVATREAGIDLGIMRLATIATTDGKCWDVPNPRHLERKLRKLRRLERQKSRRQKGSKNRDKTRRKIAIQHGAVARARRDYHHKQALALVRENQVIHVEDLNIVGLVRNRRLARVIYDAGWGQFRRVIGEKAAKYGRTMHPVSRWLASSKTCSVCGHQLAKLALHVREWTCPTCGTEHDRDRNAAEVILAAGRAERLNASHTNGPGRGSGLGGAPVSPPTEEAQDDEAGSDPKVA